MATTRRIQALIGGENHLLKKNESKGISNVTNKKRIADKSPNGKGGIKRTAFGDLTNASVSKASNLKLAAKEAVKKATVHRSRKKVDPVKKELNQNVTESKPEVIIKEKPQLPEGVEDYDLENIEDPFQEPIYSMDIFNYYKKRELQIKIEPYIQYQPDISELNRAILVDWMVEVQESFELNHETLYLAVKLVDLYLVKTKINPTTKSNLQLLGATAIFIACKFDERIPPLIDDFLYICEDAYTRSELIHMEMNIFRSINYDLGIPLSYRFLRRYARTAKLSMEVLTLARYILEMSLMKYEYITERDSLMAAAALSLALRMKNRENKETWWSKTLQYYSGYQINELDSLVQRFNILISQPTHKRINVIRTKYSHKVFYEVAKIPPLDVAV